MGGLEMRGTVKEHRVTFWGDGYIHNLNCGDGFTSVRQNISNCTLETKLIKLST